MEYIVPIETCPACGHRHRYSLIEQHIPVRNAAFGGKRRPSFLSRGTRKPESATFVPRSPIIRVSAKCPNTGSTIEVKFIEKDLINKGLNPKRISLALLRSEAK